VITKTINGGFSGSDIYVTTTKNYKYKIFQQVVYQDHLDTYLDNFYHILHLAGRKQKTQTIKNENNIFPNQSQRLARGKLNNNILTINFLSDSRYFQILQSIFFVITFFGI
jgi:hypothetical protein